MANRGFVGCADTEEGTTTRIAEKIRKGLEDLIDQFEEKRRVLDIERRLMDCSCQPVKVKFRLNRPLKKPLAGATDV
jgi:hypothetical protein